jgi:hypothetical protein
MFFLWSIDFWEKQQGINASVFYRKHCSRKVSNTTCEFEKMDDDIEMLHGIEMEVMRPT